MDIEKTVVDIISEQLGVSVSEITLEKSFVEDLDLDSLDLTEMLMSLEEVFGYSISEQDAASLRTVGDVVKYITAKTDPK